MLIREADMGDCEFIFKWRNDPLSQKMFFDKTSFSYEQHIEWFKKSLDNSSRYLFIGEVANKRVGICRFDINKEDTKAEVSININPGMRGTGLGKTLLQFAIHAFDKEKQSILTAQIKSTNKASQIIFKNAGFLEVSKKDETIQFERPLQDIIFKEVTNNDINLLYELLDNRNHSISHKDRTTFSEHENFVKSKPYKHWYLIYNGDFPLGSFYIQNDNSIGLNISKPTFFVVKRLISFIYDEFEPNDAIPSKIPSYFFMNVAEANETLSAILKEIGCMPIQLSFKLNKGVL